MQPLLLSVDMVDGQIETAPVNVTVPILHGLVDQGYRISGLFSCREILIQLSVQTDHPLFPCPPKVRRTLVLLGSSV